AGDGRRDLLQRVAERWPPVALEGRRVVGRGLRRCRRDRLRRCHGGCLRRRLLGLGGALLRRDGPRDGLLFRSWLFHGRASYRTLRRMVNRALPFLDTRPAGHLEWSKSIQRRRASWGFSTSSRSSSSTSSSGRRMVTRSSPGASPCATWKSSRVLSSPYGRRRPPSSCTRASRPTSSAPASTPSR